MFIFFFPLLLYKPKCYLYQKERMLFRNIYRKNSDGSLQRSDLRNLVSSENNMQQGEFSHSLVVHGQFSPNCHLCIYEQFSQQVYYYSIWKQRLESYFKIYHKASLICAQRDNHNQNLAEGLWTNLNKHCRTFSSKRKKVCRHYKLKGKKR